MTSYRVLCYGDSNTWGYVPGTGERFPRSIRWTGVLEYRLGSTFEVIEEGQNGRTTVWDDPIEGYKNGLDYLYPCLESHKPLDLVILMLGTNDLKARFSVTASDIAESVERLVKVIKQSGCGVGGSTPMIFVAAPPPVSPQGDLAEMFTGAREKSLSFSSRYAAMVQRIGCEFFDVGELIEVDLADGIHYDARAHAVLGNAIADRVRSIFAGE